jgi:hypothetical protein
LALGRYANAVYLSYGHPVDSTTNARYCVTCGDRIDSQSLHGPPDQDSQSETGRTQKRSATAALTAVVLVSVLAIAGVAWLVVGQRQSTAISAASAPASITPARGTPETTAKETRAHLDDLYAECGPEGEGQEACMRLFWESPIASGYERYAWKRLDETSTSEAMFASARLVFNGSDEEIAQAVYDERLPWLDRAIFQESLCDYGSPEGGGDSFSPEAVDAFLEGFLSEYPIFEDIYAHQVIPEQQLWNDIDREFIDACIVGLTDRADWEG